MLIHSGILSFGLVPIPVELYPAIEDQTIRFQWPHTKFASRVRNQFFCPVCKQVVAREELAGVSK
jgi:DNA end-binding protein Ku